jgi:YjbR
MTAADFTRIALSFEGAEQGSHMGAIDFRVGGRIFATLASIKDGYGNLMLTPEIQAAFLEDAPELFLPVHGGWGRMGITHIRLAVANRDQLTGALQTAWQLRVEKNKTPRGRTRGTSPGTRSAPPRARRAISRNATGRRRTPGR